MGYTRSIDPTVKRLLFAKSGNACAWCSSPLILDNTTNASEICHINAVNENGARFDPNLTDEYVSSYENLILLCPRCHKIIDSKENETDYTVDVLKQQKKAHEERVYQIIKNSPAVIPPISFASVKTKEIRKIYNELFEEEIVKRDVVGTLEDIQLFNQLTRSVLYAAISVCAKNGREEVDLLLTNQMVNVDFYYFALTMQMLDEQDFIIETRYVSDCDIYEDEYGDVHFVKNNYPYKVGQGRWVLSQQGKILFALYAVLGAQKFYDFMVNNNLECLPWGKD